MEFKCLTNIDTSFRQLRRYAFVFAGICAVVTVAAVWMSAANPAKAAASGSRYRFIPRRKQAAPVHAGFAMRRLARCFRAAP